MDRREERGLLAFGREGLAEAQRSEPQQVPVRRGGGGLVGQSLGRVGVHAMLGVRRVRNGWVIDDGRGTELIALRPGEVGALVTQWCESIEGADGGNGAG